MIEVKPPSPLPPRDKLSLFLAGSIEQGAAIDWQAVATATVNAHDIYVLNPRRDAWDATWIQHPDNAQFKEQVVWELDGLQQADFVLLHLEPGTKSPITLLELGLLAPTKASSLIVSCSEAFWRYGNVAIICERYNITLMHSLHAALAHLRKALSYELYGELYEP